MSVIKDIKNQMKQLACDVRKAKHDFKQFQREGKYREAISAMFKKDSLKEDFRHKHIARCLLRGKTYKQIEAKCREDNYPCSQEVTRFIHEFCALMNLDEYPQYALQKLDEGTWDLEQVDTLPVNQKLKTRMFEERRDKLISDIVAQQELEEDILLAR